ncbi:unnamed protein product [Trifolium pratense]|uniref:Uncharacterized protein n=1 Tax=Trifolium pratense TaxID=57577 RepID=A0ACB0LXM0_TRIPR|nr:unnamed protein product [Trifolium pratense]
MVRLSTYLEKSPSRESYDKTTVSDEHIEINEATVDHRWGATSCEVSIVFSAFLSKKISHASKELLHSDKVNPSSHLSSFIHHFHFFNITTLFLLYRRRKKHSFSTIFTFLFLFFVHA